VRLRLVLALLFVAVCVLALGRLVVLAPRNAYRLAAAAL
jgi:hypothetical protein